MMAILITPVVDCTHMHPPIHFIFKQMSSPLELKWALLPWAKMSSTWLSSCQVRLACKKLAASVTRLWCCKMCCVLTMRYSVWRFKPSLSNRLLIENVHSQQISTKYIAKSGQNISQNLNEIYFQSSHLRTPNTPIMARICGLSMLTEYKPLLTVSESKV